MFTRRNGTQYCVIHPDVEIAFGSAKIKNKLRAIMVCPKCDALVEKLRATKTKEE